MWSNTQQRLLYLPWLQPLSQSRPPAMPEYVAIASAYAMHRCRRLAVSFIAMSLILRSCDCAIKSTFSLIQSGGSCRSYILQFLKLRFLEAYEAGKPSIS